MPDPASAPSIPGFRVLGVAGRGGMGTVFRAEQASPRRVVALKVLNRARIDEGSLTAFRREAEIIAGLEHPAIVPLYTYGEHRGVPYLVFRFLPGGSAAEAMGRGPLEVGAAARWVQTVAEALGFAHARGIVHRDVKPSNILFDGDGNPHLTDFGIAGAFEAGEDAESGLGSAPYISPEQVRGEAAGPASDLYSLTATLFELVVGEVPFPAESAVGMRVRHLHDPVPSAWERNPGVPPALDDLLRWGLAKDPGDRPSGASEFSRLLGQGIAQPETRLSPAAGPGGVVGQVEGRAARGLPSWAAMAGLIAALGLGVLLVGGVGALLWFNRGDDGTAPAGLAPTRTPVSAVEAPPPTATPDGLLLADDFSDPASGFATGSDQDGGVEYRGGRLSIRALNQGVEWFSPSGRVAARDVEVRVSVASIGEAQDAHLALVCRWRDAANYTALAMGLDGSRGVWQRVEGEVRWLVDWSPAPEGAGGPEAGSVLRAVCTGQDLALWLDGVLLGTAVDPDPAAGDVALMAGLRGRDAFEVELEEIRVGRPDQGIE